MGMFPGGGVPKGWDDRLPLVIRRAGAGGSRQMADLRRENPAVLRLLNANSQSLLPIGLSGSDAALARAVLAEMGGARSNGMASFIVTGVSYQDGEKLMVMPTFGDDFAIYFMGRAPRRISVQGVLIDDYFNNWFYKFLKVYDMLLRGTRLARYFRLLQLDLHNASMTGVITGITYSQSSNNDTQVAFGFDMILKSYEPISSPGVDVEQASANAIQTFRVMDGQKGLLSSTLSALPTTISSQVMDALYKQTGDDILDAVNREQELRDAEAYLFSDEFDAALNKTAASAANRKAPKKSLLTSLSDGVKSVKGVISDVQKSLRDVSGFISQWQTKVRSVVDPLVKSIQDFKDVAKQVKRVQGDVVSFAKTARKLVKDEARILRSGKLGSITSGASLRNIQNIASLGDKLPVVGAQSSGNVLNGLSKATSGLDNLTQFSRNARNFGSSGLPKVSRK